MVEIIRQINSDVETVLRQHRDGTPFFDAIDSRLTHRVYFDYLRDRILNDGGAPYDGIVSSGKFGWAFSVYANPIPAMPPVVNFPGDLRHQPLVDPRIDPMFNHKRFVFVDNSVYKGRTLKQINDYVRDWGGQIKVAFILYDGSRPPYDWTRMGIMHDYLYRWHNEGFRP